MSQAEVISATYPVAGLRKRTQTGDPISGLSRGAANVHFHRTSTAAFAAPGWVSPITITVGTSTTVSNAVEIPNSITDLAIEIPTITSATINLSVSVDNVTFQNYLGISNGTNQILWSTAAGTGAVTALVPGNIGLFRFVKVISGSAQAADRTFRLIGR